MTIRKRMLAFLFTAICLFGILPLSVSANTPVVEGALYNFTTPDRITATDQMQQFVLTPIDGTLNYFACEMSPDNIGTVAIDVLSSEITEIGFKIHQTGSYLQMKVKLNGSAYIPALSQLPLFFQNQPGVITIFRQTIHSPPLVEFALEGQTVRSFAITEINFTLNHILESTNMDILRLTLEAFETNLTADNYVSWILSGYNGIIDVFVNNAKVQYVMDNPVFVIALVVFAMAIAFAVATFIFKIFGGTN